MNKKAHMKTYLRKRRVVFCLLVSLGMSGVAQAEDWKGESSQSQMSVGAMSGMGIIGYSAGWSLFGTVSKKILPSGFVPDMNNSVSIEVAMGTTFLNSVLGSSIFMYSAHLRWDFEKDSKWAFYGLGGLGGSTSGLTPRFGVGSFFRLQNEIRLRFELAHDLIGVGVNFQF